MTDTTTEPTAIDKLNDIERTLRLADATPALYGNDYVSPNEWGMAYHVDVAWLVKQRKDLFQILHELWEQDSNVGEWLRERSPDLQAEIEARRYGR